MSDEKVQDAVPPEFSGSVARRKDRFARDVCFVGGMTGVQMIIAPNIMGDLLKLLPDVVNSLLGLLGSAMSEDDPTRVRILGTQILALFLLLHLRPKDNRQRRD